jgi:hypothetical protein
VLIVPWLTHLAGPPVAPSAAGTEASEREPLLRALADALPELALYVEPRIAARGVPDEAFVGAPLLDSAAFTHVAERLDASPGGPTGRALAAHRARARRAHGEVDYPAAGAALFALQTLCGKGDAGGGAWRRAGAATLARAACATDAAQRCLLVTIAALAAARMPRFLAAAAAALPASAAGRRPDGPRLLAVALAMPELAPGLLPAYSALQGAFIVAGGAHHSMR